MNENNTNEDDLIHLETRLHNLEKEKQRIDSERMRLEQELNVVRSELDRLREPPLVGAVIVGKMPGITRSFIVQVSNGMLCVVKSSQKVREESLTPGTYVALNQRTFAIVKKLALEESQLWNAIKKLMLNYFISIEDVKKESDNE